MQQKYIEQMEEIRRRIESIEIMTEVENTRLYLPVCNRERLFAN